MGIHSSYLKFNGRRKFDLRDSESLLPPMYCSLSQLSFDMYM
jgi:hypothetical protein